ncbi:MAG: replication-relaxation family protein [Pseudonocardiaceae bacterium]
MITNPTRQRTLRGHRPTRPTPRAANSTDHQATLAARLTRRDRWIIRMLHEHRVLTSSQITALAFPSFRSGRQRLRELYCWNVVDRFQPFITLGTTPMHYVLAPAGATVLAAEHGLDVKDLGYRHDRALAISHNLRLAHTVGVNDWFTALISRACAHPGEAVGAWWSESRCARHFGDLVRPDAYGRYEAQGHQIEFFLEFDLGTETLARVAGKLTGYAQLAAATAITTPILVWLPTTRREATARRLLTQAHHELDQPAAVPVATAAADLLNPHSAHPNPASPIWLPLGPIGNGLTRQGLHQLGGAWPHLPAPTTCQPTPGRVGPDQSRSQLPAPIPMPPAPSGTRACPPSGPPARPARPG